MLKHAALLSITLSLLASCASMDKSECLTADWRTIGFEDGAKGKNETAISEYRKDCAEHGVTPDLTAYRKGHREGTERYCTTRNGFAVGKSGNSYQNSCAADLEPDFLTGYRDGQQLYSLQRALNNAHAAVDKQQRLLSSLEQDIEAKTDLLVEDGLKKEQRIALLEEIDAMKAQFVDAVNALPGLERDVAKAEKLLAQSEKRFSHYQ